MMHPIVWVSAHLKAAMFLTAAALQIINAMPTPAATGPTASWGYKWAFAALHGPHNIARIAFAFWPKFMGVIPQPDPEPAKVQNAVGLDSGANKTGG
jgi:hypothetical protein